MLAILILLFLLLCPVQPLAATGAATWISDVMVTDTWSTLSRRYPSGFL